MSQAVEAEKWQATSKKLAWQNYETSYRLFVAMQKSSADVFSNGAILGIEVSSPLLVRGLTNLTSLYEGDPRQLLFNIQKLWEAVGKHCGTYVEVAYFKDIPESVSVILRGGEDLHLVAGCPAGDHSSYRDSKLLINSFYDRSEIFGQSDLIYGNHFGISYFINLIAGHLPVDQLARVSRDLLSVVGTEIRQSAEIAL